jgi:hypothetical protein
MARQAKKFISFLFGENADLIGMKVSLQMQGM